MDNKGKFDKVRYNNDYNKSAYDRISLMLPKGKKELIRAHADSKGESVNAFINRAIDALLEQEGEVSGISGGAGIK